MIKQGYRCECGATWVELGPGLWGRDDDLGGDPECQHKVLTPFRYV